MYHPLKPRRSAGWKAPLSPRAMGRLTLLAGALAACLYLALGNIAFRIITDPEMVPLYYNSASNGSMYFQLLGICFGIAVIIGLASAILLANTRLPFKEASLLLAMILPPVGLTFFLFSVGSSDYSGFSGEKRANLRNLVWAGALTAILPLVVFEASWESNKAAGSLFLSALADFLAIYSLVLAAYVSGGLRAWPAWAPAAPTYPYSVLPGAGSEAAPPISPATGADSTKFHYSASSGNPTGSAWKPLLLLAVVLPLVFVPPMERLWSGPVLEIADESGTGTQESKVVEIYVRVVNRGGQATSGPVEIRVSNATGVVASTIVGSLEGFGVRNVSFHVEVSTLSKARPLNFNISLLYKGRQVDAGNVHIVISTAGCMIVPMIVTVALAGAALPPLMGKRKRRAGP